MRESRAVCVDVFDAGRAAELRPCTAAVGRGRYQGQIYKYRDGLCEGSLLGCKCLHAVNACVEIERQAAVTMRARV